MTNTDMTLLKIDGTCSPDPYTICQDHDSFESLKTNVKSLLLPYALFQADPDSFSSWKAVSSDRQLGIFLAPDEDIAILESHLSLLNLIALDFPVFTDGRNYSTARLLREKYGYTEEIRAFGQILEDQLPLLARCGCDHFLLPAAHAQIWWQRAQSHITIAYQPTGKRFTGTYAGRRRHHLSSAGES